MSSKRWVGVCSMGFGVVVACATADDQNPDDGGGDSPRGGGGASSSAGKSTSAGTNASAGTAVSEGGKSSSGGVGGVAGGAGKTSTTTGGTAQAGSSSGGKGGGGAGGMTGNGGKGGTTSGGTSSAGTTSGGTTSGGTTSGGTGSMLGCSVDATGGAEAQAGAGGASGAHDLFFDDFEAGNATKWTTTLGTWGIVDDESKAYEQSLQENKLQIAIANGLCAADQIIDARIKVIGFKGQSNSYVAALFGRVVSPATHYLLALGSDNKLALRKRVNSTSTGATAIGSAKALTVNEGQWYDLHFELVGTNLKGCVGDVCVTGTDSSIAAGSVGVGTVNTSARFDEVRVSAP